MVGFASLLSALFFNTVIHCNPSLSKLGNHGGRRQSLALTVTLQHMHLAYSWAAHYLFQKDKAVELASLCILSAFSSITYKIAIF